MRIHRGVAAAVADDDGVTVARAGTSLIVASLGHSAACRCVDGRTRCSADIHALVAAAVPARAVAVAGHRPDELTAAGDVGGAVGHLLGALHDLFGDRLLHHFRAQDLLGKLDAIGVINTLRRDLAQAVHAVLHRFLGAHRVLVGGSGLGGVGDLFLPCFHLGDAHFQRGFLLGDDQFIPCLNVGFFI